MSQVELNQNMTHCIEEDEIDLKELWKTIKDGKKLIVSIVSIVVLFTFVYVLSIPNSYKAQAVLIPTSQEGGANLGGLGGLAAMAGISVGGGNMTPDVAFNSLLNNYDFMKKFIVKNKIYDNYMQEDRDKNYVFALGFRGLYDFFSSGKGKDVDKDKKLFDLVKFLQKSISISADKKSGLISVSYIDYDREYAPQVVNMFLDNASRYLVKNNLDIIESKLEYFSKELQKAESFELRTSISGMISKIVQEKVMMKSKRYYQCDVLTSPSVAYVKDKTKPKRALILIVSFVTSIILGIFLVFFRNFIKNED